MKINRQNIKRGLNILKWSVNDALIRSKVLKDSQLSTGKKTILLYHGVDDMDNRTINSKFISAKRIFEQLSWLKENATIVPIKEYFESPANNKRHVLSLTFDDGFLNNYTHLYPIIKELNIPISIYITTVQLHGYNYLWPDYIDICSIEAPDKLTIEEETFFKKNNHFFDAQGRSLKSKMKKMDGNQKKRILKVFEKYTSFMSKKEMDIYWKLMTEEHWKKITQDPNITLGTHGTWHNNLSEINIEDAKKELLESKSYLENVIQKEVNEIAYPDGDYTRDLINISEECGYKYQLASDYLYSDDKLDKRVKNRLGINPYISWNNQINVINKGHY